MNGAMNNVQRRKKVTRSVVENYLICRCGANPAMTKVVKLSEPCNNGILRHSCVRTGVCTARMTRINVEGYTIDYCWFRCCNKIVYYIDEI